MRIAKQVMPKLLIALLVMICVKDSLAQYNGEKWLNATWEGIGIQTDGLSWTIRLSVKGDKYLIEYPSLSCRGEWILTGMDSKKATFKEKLTSGLSKCINDGTVLIERINDSQIKYSYTAPNSKKVLASTTLRKSAKNDQENAGRTAVTNNTQRPRVASSQNREETYFQQNRDPIHKSGTKLLETESYAVFKKHPYYSNLRRSVDEFCKPYFGDRSKSEARISIVHKVNADYPLTDDKEYRRRFEEEIFPVVKEQCANIKVVFMDNYIYNVRINHDGQEFSYGQQLPAGFDEWPLNSIYAYSEADGFRYEVQARNDPSSRTYVSLNSLRKIRERAAADEAARREEERRQAEIQRQEKIKTRRDADLAKAAEVLNFFKKNSPEKYDFSNYATEETLENIYQGNFEPFTGGYESPEEVQNTVVGSTLRTADPGNLSGFLSGMIANGAALSELNRRRRSLNMSFYAYHNVYKEQCFSNKEMLWTLSTRYEFYLTKGDVRVPGSEREGIVAWVRKPFSQTYDRVYVSLADTSDVSPDMPETYLNDYRRFLKTEGCASPAVRHFEINLYLAARWLLPLQDLLQASRASAGGKQIPSTSAPPQFQVSEYLLTDLQIHRGEKVTVTASGSIILGAFAGASSPEGIAGFEPYSYFRQYPHGSLLVRVRGDQNSGWTPCGSSCSFLAERDGALELLVNDKDASNNRGRYQVKVKIDK